MQIEHFVNVRVTPIVFTQSAWQDYPWSQEHYRHLLQHMHALIKDAQRSPFRGIGKPEPLKGELSGYWSRRINAEHRLVYGVSDTELTIISCRFHYVR
jgi:toxin YoeB